MISRIRMRIFLPVLLLIVLFPILSWLLFSSTSDWYMERLSRQSLAELMDSIQSIEDDLYSGRDARSLTPQEEKELSKEMMSRIKTFIRRDRPQARLIAMNSRMKLTYPKQSDYQSDTQGIYKTLMEMVLSGQFEEDGNGTGLGDEGRNGTGSGDERRNGTGLDGGASPLQMTFGQTHYLVSLHETESTGNIRGKYLIGYVDVPDTGILLSYTGRLLFIISCFLALLSTAVVWLMAGSIARPLESLCRHAKNIGKGWFEPVDAQYTVREVEDLKLSLNRMAGELEQMDQQQKHFFQNASHELRTPLMSICGYAQGILCNVFPDHGQAAQVIISEAMRMKELVDSILTLSRLDSRSLSVQAEAVELHRFVEEQRESLKGMEFLEKINLVYRWEVPGPSAAETDIAAAPPGTGDAAQHGTGDTARGRAVLPVIAWADSSLLTQAFRNIISNCARYASQDVTVTVSQEDGWAVIQIADDGPGFGTADLPHIFERFYKGPRGNFGIGLSIVQSAMEYMGGKVSAANKMAPGHGAVFCLYLPGADENK